MQSVHGIIRLFPAWPKDKDAAFSNLRAQGGFLVSAEQKSGKVLKVGITATVPGRLRMLSPWKNVRVIKSEKNLQVMSDEDGIITLQTKAGDGG
ncbi:MAG: hypothetical protein GY845_15245 [Planctomycetes bacterium]|nr:hypothetical protein [Planctomycetota bacterium]